MRTRNSRALWVGLSATLVAACADSRNVDHAVGQPMDVTSVTDHLVFVDHAQSEALLLDVSKSAQPRAASIVPLVANPTHEEGRNQHPDQLLVLSAGQPDDGVAAPSQPGLAIVGASGPSKTFRYDSAYDAIAQSDDGTTALLYFTANAATTDTVLFNPNEIAILNLDAKSGTAPTVLTPRPLGGTIQSVAFSPPHFTIAGVERHLVVVLFNTYLNILDLDHLTKSEFSVPLSDATSGVTLAQIVFSDGAAGPAGPAGADEPKLYVRAKGANDVFVVTLSPRTGDDTKNDFVPSRSQLPAGSAPSDLLLYTDNDKPRVLVTSPGSSQLVVVESDSNNVTNIPLPASAANENILSFAGPSPSDAVDTVNATSIPRALIVAPGSSTVTFVDLVKLDEKGANNLETVSISQPYGPPIRLDDRTLMLPHLTTGLSVLDLWERTVSVISGPSLTGAVADRTAEKLWLAHDDRLGYLDLTADYHPNEVRVDAPIEHLVIVPSAVPKIVTTHASRMGWATVLEAKSPSNLAAAYSVRGFFFDGVLQGGSR